MADDDDVCFIGSSAEGNSLQTLATNRIESRKRRRLESAISQSDDSQWPRKRQVRKVAEPSISTAYGQYIRTGTYVLPASCYGPTATAAAAAAAPVIASTKPTVTVPVKRLTMAQAAKNARYVQTTSWAKVRMFYI